ncbi:Invasion associated locus B (IalB) protein [compost metagenome]
MKFAFASVVSLSLVLANAANAQETAKPADEASSAITTQRFDDWNYRCGQVALEQGKTASQCEVVQVARVKQGEEEVSLLTLPIAKTAPNAAEGAKKDSDAALLLTALVPLNIFLPVGFGLDVDGKAVADTAYRNCNQAGCWVQQRLESTTLAALQKGQMSSTRSFPKRQTVSKVRKMVLLGKTIQEFRSRSFFMDGQRQCDCSVLYLKTEDGSWFSFTIGEGYSRIVEEKEEPFIINLDSIDDDFAYPVQNVSFLEEYVGNTIVAINELKLKDRENIVVGLYVELGINGFTLYEDNDCLFLEKGLSTSLLETCDLIKAS